MKTLSAAIKGFIIVGVLVAVCVVAANAVHERINKDALADCEARFGMFMVADGGSKCVLPWQYWYTGDVE